MFSKIFPREYDDYFILEMLKNAKAGVVVSNIIAPLIVLVILYDYIPTIILGTWFFLLFSLYFMRIYFSAQLVKNIKASSKDKTKNLKFYTITTTATSLLLGVSSLFQVFYMIPDIHFFTLIIGIIIITAGSIATLATIYIIFFYFVLFSILPFIGSLVYQSGDISNLYASILILFLILYLFFGYSIYKSRKKAYELEKKFKTIFNKSSDGIAIIKRNRVIECNETMLSLFHYNNTIDDFLNSNLLLLMPKKQIDGLASIRKMLRKLEMAQNKTITFEWLHTKVDGEIFWAEITLRPITVNHEKVIHGVWNEITKRKKAEADLKELNATLEQKVELRTKELKKIKDDFEYLATTDSLTNMHNRYSLMKILTHEINRANRYKQPLSVIMYDIDNFKKVNDTFGHDIGDDILISLSHLVKKSLRDTDILGRYGGEEFFILLPNTELNDAEIYANRLREEIENFSFYIVKNITISLGLVLIEENEDIDDIFKRVDELLYKSKNSGRNRVSS